MELSGHKTRGILFVALTAAWLSGGSLLAWQGSTPTNAPKPAAHPPAASSHTTPAQPSTGRTTTATTPHSPAVQKNRAHAPAAPTIARTTGAPARYSSATHNAPVRNASHATQHTTQHPTSTARSHHYVPLNGQQRLARLHLEPDRVQQIQAALIREGYLQGDATGLWDAHTHDAMLHYQTDHGFPATGQPEAKSLMKLGLGSHPLPPDLDHGPAGAAAPSAAGDAAQAATTASQVNSPPIPK